MYMASLLHSWHNLSPASLVRHGLNLFPNKRGVSESNVLGEVSSGFFETGYLLVNTGLWGWHGISRTMTSTEQDDNLDPLHFIGVFDAYYGGRGLVDT